MTLRDALSNALMTIRDLINSALDVQLDTLVGWVIALVMVGYIFSLIGQAMEAREKRRREKLQKR